LIVAERLQAFKLQVSTLQLLRVALLEQQSLDQARDHRFVREDPDNVSMSFDFRIKPLQGMVE
jgi:hypothetical protein